MEEVKQPFSLFARTQKLCCRAVLFLLSSSSSSSSSIFDLCLRGAPRMQRLEPLLTLFSIVLDPASEYTVGLSFLARATGFWACIVQKSRTRTRTRSRTIERQRRSYL